MLPIRPSVPLRQTPEETVVLDNIAFWESQLKGQPKHETCMSRVRTLSHRILQDLRQYNSQRGSSKIDLKKFAEESISKLNQEIREYCPLKTAQGLDRLDRDIAHTAALPFSQSTKIDALLKETNPIQSKKSPFDELLRNYSNKVAHSQASSESCRITEITDPNLGGPAFRLCKNLVTNHPDLEIERVSHAFFSELCYEFVSCKLGFPITLDDPVSQMQKSGYSVVKTPQKNDVILYFSLDDRAGKFKHIGIIDKVEGDKVWVESKWGYLPIYRHEQGTIAKEYGDAVVYLRAPSEQTLPPLGQCDHHSWKSPWHLCHSNGLPCSDAAFNQRDRLSPKEIWEKYAKDAIGVLKLEWIKAGSQSTSSRQFEERLHQAEKRSLRELEEVLKIEFASPIRERQIVSVVDAFNQAARKDFEDLFINGIKLSHTSTEHPRHENHGTVEEIAAEIGVGWSAHKAAHKYGKNASRAIETIAGALESVQGKITDTPARDMLVSGVAHTVIMACADAALKRTGIPGYQAIAGAHALAKAAGAVQVSAQKFLDTTPPEECTRDFPYNPVAEPTPNLCEVVEVAKLTAQLAQQPSKGLHAVHKRLTEAGKNILDAVGITNDNINAAYTHLKENPAPEELWLP